MAEQITLTVSNALIHEAQELGQHDNETETVLVALQSYIERLRQQQIFELFGTIEYYPDYDYKQLRLDR